MNQFNDWGIANHIQPSLFLYLFINLLINWKINITLHSPKTKIINHFVILKLNIIGLI